MKPHTQSFSSSILAGILCIFFFFAGLLFLPLIGIEGDEPLFVHAVYIPQDVQNISVLHAKIPIMLMSYLGTLKAWIYAPILHIFPGSVITLRLPALIAGTASVWMFFLLLRRVAGPRAALIGCALLSLDSIYLLTVCFDWGPVALQHLCLIGGTLCLVRFYQERQEWALAAGAFLFGLAMWDKALAVWLLSGMVVATILTFPRQLFGLFTRRRVAIAAAAGLLGALPLVVFNVKHKGETFRGNVQWDLAGLRGKVVPLYLTAKGNGLFGYMPAEDSETPQPHRPQGVIQTASVQLSDLAGHPREHLLILTFAAAVLLSPLAGWAIFRTVVWCLLVLSIAWLQMAANKLTGGSVHHIVLLWPLPQAVIGLALAGASRRLGKFGAPAAALVVAVPAVAGLLVMNEYHAVAVRNGGAVGWNNGIVPAAEYLKKSAPSRVYSIDWGLTDPMLVLSNGKLAMRDMGEAPDDMRAALADPGAVILGRTAKFAEFPDRAAALNELAAKEGYRREMLATLDDGFGRQAFEVYRFVK